MSNLHSGGMLGAVIGAVARFGDRPALSDGAIHWSYREFGEAVGRFVTLFQDIGLGKGHALSIVSSNAPNPGSRSAPPR